MIDSGPVYVVFVVKNDIDGACVTEMVRARLGVDGELYTIDELKAAVDCFVNAENAILKRRKQWQLET